MPQSHLCSFTVLPSITEMSGNQTVTEGGNVTLKCLAYGKPTPNVTWTRISDNRIVSMPLTDITPYETSRSVYSLLQICYRCAGRSADKLQIICRMSVEYLQNICRMSAERLQRRSATSLQICRRSADEISLSG